MVTPISLSPYTHMETKTIQIIERIETELERLEQGGLLNDERIKSIWSCLMAIKREVRV